MCKIRSKTTKLSGKLKILRFSIAGSDFESSWCVEQENHNENNKRYDSFRVIEQNIVYQCEIIAKRYYLLRQSYA